MNPTKIKSVVILIIALILAVIIGNMTVTDQTGAAVWVGGGAIILICLFVGSKIWMAIPLFMICNLFFRWMPGHLTLVQASMVTFVSFMTIQMVLRKVRVSYRPAVMDVMAILLLFLVAQVYLRNPVGLSMTGSANVGAKPYLNFVVAFVTYVYLSCIVVPVREIMISRTCAVFGGVISFIAQCLSYVPGLAYPMALFFGTGNTSFGQEGVTGGAENSADTGRNFAGQTGAKVLPRVLVGFIGPLKALISVKWFWLIALSGFCALFSGFRSMLIEVGLVFLVGTWFWHGKRAVFVAFVVACMGVALLAAVNSVSPLPGRIQRTLSFLPGTWENRYVESGENSTNWRVEIWEEVLTSDQWIKNKFLGDGLGFTQKELAMQEDIAYRQQTGGHVFGAAAFDVHREAILVNGDYHSGPISMVRTIGYLGMIIFTIALIGLWIKASKTIKMYKGTPYFGVVAFFCIPLIVHPIKYIFVIGSFGTDTSLFLIHLGLLNLILRSLPSPQEYFKEIEEKVHE